MATSTYILSINDFTNRADLSSNLNTNTLKQYFGITQEKFLVAVICQETYDAIIDELSQGGEAYLSTKYANLLPFIKDFLVYKTMERYYTNANYKSTPAGIREHTDTISSKAPNTAMEVLTKQANDDAEFYKDKLINYLDNNRETYTLWADSRCNCGQFTKGAGGFQFSSNKSTRNIIKWS